MNDLNNIELALVGLGWKVKQPFTPPNFDLDASVFMLGENGKLMQDDDLVFYNNKNGRNGAVVLSLDSRKGVTETGDAEIMMIDFRRIPEEIKKLAICVSVFDGDKRNQNFGQIEGAYIRIAKLADEFDDVGEQVLKFNLEKEFPLNRSLIMAEVVRENGGWRFIAVANGSNRGGLEELCKFYGGEIEE